MRFKTNQNNRNNNNNENNNTKKGGEDAIDDIGQIFADSEDEQVI